MRLLVLLVVGLGLAGCVSNKPVAEMSYTEVVQLAGTIESRCVAQGVRRGTADWDICTKQEVNREVARRNRIASQPPTVICNRIGDTVICN